MATGSIWRRRVFWIIADVAVVAILLGLLAAILLPSYLGAGDEGPEMPTVRERLRR